MKKLLVLIIIFNCQFFIVNCTAQAVTTTVLSNVSCYGLSNGSAKANPLGGLTPYTYQWLPGGQTNQTATGLTAGAFTIHLTDHLGHTASAVAIISQPAALSVTASAKLTSVCAGQSDSLFATASGGTLPFSYSWTGPYDDISNPSAAKTLCYPYGAAYIVTAIYDLNGCSASASISVGVHPIPLTTISGPISPIAPGRSDTLIALASGATSYLWSNSSTVSAIIVSPAVSTTYSVKATNTYGCYDTAHYTIDTNSIGNGTSSSNAIRIVPSTSVVTSSFSTLDSVVWFSFVAADSNNQIIANSAYLGLPFPHVHRLTLYNNSMQILVDEPMPDIVGANQIRIDISHLQIGNTYYVRAARTPAHANMAGCNPSLAGECNPTQRWDFQMCFRTVPVFVPKDSGAEAPDVSQLYYESRGQIPDLNSIPRFDIKAYTNNTKPAIFCSDSGVSFVYQHVDTAKSFIDTVQRVDMVLAGSSVQPSQPVFKMEEDSNAGYLNYFLGYVPNGVPKVEGYSRLVYKNVYPNTDMQVYSNTMGTKLYFICNPAVGTSSGGNPANIELQFKGASSVSVNGGGGLDVVTELGTLTFAPGYAYTDSAGIIKPKSWQAYFVAVNSNTVKFNTGSFNSNEPLIIQVDRGHKMAGSNPPIANLDWSTYFGGADLPSMFNDVCSDKQGNIYATGSTQSAFYPVTVGVVQETLYQYNVNYVNGALAKFDSSDARVWATYYGGSIQTVGFGVGIDVPGNVYITGFTESYDMPPASVPSSPNNYAQHGLSASNGNAFIAMFSNDGTKTYWATFYGGPYGGEIGRHLSIDRDTNIYIVGGGLSGNKISHFPLYRSSKAGAYNDTTYGKGFILEFNASHAFNPSVGITRTWATRIGDSIRGDTSDATLFGCTVDASNNFYVTGQASGRGYTSPATLTFPFQDEVLYTYPGDNAVVTKFNSNNHIDWSSYYGGNDNDGANTITVDQSGNIYIAGITTSDSVGTGVGIETQPLGSGFFQRNNANWRNGGDGFIAEFSQSGSLEWGTYFGGTSILSMNAISIDAYNNLYVTGYDEATNMPLPGSNPGGVYSQRSFVSGPTAYNAFITAFSNANSNPDYIWGTYFGNNVASGMCLAHSNSTNWLYIVGNLGNGNTPQVYPVGSYQQNIFFFESDVSGTSGTSFISQFDVNTTVFAGTNNINKSSNGIIVYPNPTVQNVTVQIILSKAQDVEFILYNVMGEMVYDRKLSAQTGLMIQRIDLSLLANGAYLLKVNEGDKYMTQKIVKQN